MRHRTFAACALLVLAVELLALGRQPVRGPSTAEVERIVAGELQVRNHEPVSDVRCVRRADDAATCVALMYGGWRTRVAVTIDFETRRVESIVES